MSPSLIQMKQLEVVKSIFNEGRGASTIDHDIQNIKAALYLDLAVEYVLNIVVEGCSKDGGFGRKDENWNTLWQKAVSSLHEAGINYTLPHYKELRRLHEVRNLAQHNGSIPNRSEILRYIVPVQEMIYKTVKEIYGIEIERMRAWEFIYNESIKKWMVDCELAAEMKEYVFAIAGCFILFYDVLKSIRGETHIGVWNGKTDLGSIKRYRKPYGIKDYDVKELSEQLDITHKELEELGKSAANEIDSLRDDVVIAQIGIPIDRTRKFLSAIHVIEVRVIGGEIVLKGRSGFAKGEFEENSREALEYMSSLLLMVQDQMPESVSRTNFKTGLLETRIWLERDRIRTEKKNDWWFSP